MLKQFRTRPAGGRSRGILVAASLAAALASVLLGLSLLVGTSRTDAQAVTVLSPCPSPLPIGASCPTLPSPTALPSLKPLPSAVPTQAPPPGSLLPSPITNGVPAGQGSVVPTNPVGTGAGGSPMAASPAIQNSATPLVPSSDLLMWSQMFSGWEVVTQLVTMLSNPVTTQAPDLGHFPPPATTTDPQSRSDPLAESAGHPLLHPWEAQALVLLMIVLLAALALRAGATKSAASTKAALMIALLPLGLAGLMAGHMLGVKADPLNAILPAPSVAPGSTATQVLDVRDRHGEVGAARSQLLWQRLVAIESRVAAERQQLIQLESAARQLAINAPSQNDAGQQPVTASRTRAVERIVTQQVTRLVTTHVTVQPIYEQDLRTEYEIYQQAVQNPALRAALLEDSRSLGNGVTQVVAQNLALVALQAQQDALVNSSTGNATLTPGQLAALPASGKFQVPVSGLLVQVFGPTNFALEPPAEYRGIFYPHFHTGIDIAANQGTPVHAAADGVVALVASMTDGHGHLVGYGNFVTILHRDGVLTLYAHLESVAVKAGQVVRQGQVIGAVGSTGWSTGPHLHFEIRKAGALLDPLPYLQ